MAYKLGIIPAAGQASRFGGLNKELLPTRDGTSFLMKAVQRLPVDRVVIVTNTDKIAAHARVIGSAADYDIQQGASDICGAIKHKKHFWHSVKISPCSLYCAIIDQIIICQNLNAITLYILTYIADNSKLCHIMLGQSPYFNHS